MTPRERWRLARSYATDLRRGYDAEATVCAVLEFPAALP